MSAQQFCVVEYWRGIVNGVFGPFPSHKAAEDFAAKRRAERGNARDTVELQPRLLTGGKA